MADPILAQALAPTMKLGDKEHKLFLTPRDVIQLSKDHKVDVLTRTDANSGTSLERAALVIAQATHDPEVTADTILDGLNVGEIVQYGKEVLENAAAGIKRPTPTA